MTNDVRQGLSRCAELAYNRTAAVREHHRATSFDNGRGLRGHDVRAKIEFARRDADDGDHDRSGKTDHHNLEVGGAVCGVQRRVHATDEITSNANGTLSIRTMPPIPTYKTPLFAPLRDGS